MSMQWPDGEDFVQLVANAMKDRRTAMASRMREALAGPDVLDRTINALEIIVDRIDDQLEGSLADSSVLERRERARSGMWDWVVWYQQVRTLYALDEASDG